MIDALIGGSLIDAPQEKTSAAGRPYVQARVRVPMADGESAFVLASCFDGEARRALLAHASGDSVALTGPIRLGVWTPPNGGSPRVNVSMMVHGVLSAYAIKRRRAGVQGEGEQLGRTTRSPAPRSAPQDRGEAFADDSLDDAF